MSKETNYNSIAKTIAICVAIIVVSAVFISMFFNYNQSNNYSYTPPYNDYYNPSPTPTPTPQPRPNVERVDLRGEWFSEKISTGLLSSKTIHHYTITATFYNKGTADATMKLTYSMTYTQGGSERTVEDTQIVQLKAGEVKVFTCTLRDVPSTSHERPEMRPMPKWVTYGQNGSLS